jgi:hypothetical protein
MSGFAGVLAPELALAGVAGAAERHRGGLRPLVGDGFRPDAVTRAWGNAGRSPATTSGCAPAAIRSTRRWTRWKTSSPSSGRLPTASSASTWQPTASPRTCASRPGQLLRGQVLAAARGGRPGAARPRGLSRLHRRVVRDPAIAAFRRRVHVREDPELSAQVPRLKPARVTVTLTDGRQVTRLRESARGDFQDPYREDESARSSASWRAWCSARRRGPGGGPRRSPRRPAAAGDLVVTLREDRGR